VRGAEAPAAYGEVGVMGASSWETILDAIATRGMEFRRDPYPIALYIGLGLTLLVIFLTPLFMRSNGDLPLDIVVMAAIGSAALMLVSRVADVLTARRLTLRDNGIESYRGEKKLALIHWRDVSRAGFPPFFVSPILGRGGDTIWLPGSFDGRDLLAACVAWCFANRAEIAANGGSITRALDAMADRDGISFGFDWRSSIISTTLMGGLVAGMTAVVVLDKTPIAQQSLLTIGVCIVVFCILASLFVAALFAWTEVSIRVVVSSRGVSITKKGRTITALTWDDIVKPDALKQRRKLIALACDASGKTVITSSNIHNGELLNAVVDRVLVRELKRRDKLKTLTPTDVWGKPDN